MRKVVAGVLLVLMVVAGCAKEESMFVIVEEKPDWTIVADRETGVMYGVSRGGFNKGDFTLLVDEEGNPLIWEGGEDNGK